MEMISHPQRKKGSPRLPCFRRSDFDDRQSRRSEPVVQPRTDNVEIDVVFCSHIQTVARIGHIVVIKTVRGAAEIDIGIFALEAHIAGQRIFDTAADRVTGARFRLRSVDSGELRTRCVIVVVDFRPRF